MWDLQLVLIIAEQEMKNLTIRYKQKLSSLFNSIPISVAPPKHQAQGIKAENQKQYWQQM